MKLMASRLVIRAQVSMHVKYDNHLTQVHSPDKDPIGQREVFSVNEFFTTELSIRVEMSCTTLFTSPYKKLYKAQNII